MWKKYFWNGTDLGQTLYLSLTKIKGNNTKRNCIPFEVSQFNFPKEGSQCIYCLVCGTLNLSIVNWHKPNYKQKQLMSQYSSPGTISCLPCTSSVISWWHCVACLSPYPSSDNLTKHFFLIRIQDHLLSNQNHLM